MTQSKHIKQAVTFRPCAPYVSVSFSIDAIANMCSVFDTVLGLFLEFMCLLGNCFCYNLEMWKRRTMYSSAPLTKCFALAIHRCRCHLQDNAKLTYEDFMCFLEDTTHCL